MRARLPISLFLTVGLFLLFQARVIAARAERVTYLGLEFVIFSIDVGTDQLSLHWRDSTGKPLGTFTRLREHLRSQKSDLRFAINAGIFSQGYQPLGLHIEATNVLRELNLREMEGGQVNFYMKPNGVFYVADYKPGILESAEFAQRQLRPWLACQSEPLLLRDGRINPAFQPGSTNLHWRSGVGITQAGQVIFAISKSRLCFHDLARFFQARLGCDNALYLDGDICAIYLPEMGYKGEDPATRFAGMFAVTRGRNP